MNTHATATLVSPVKTVVQKRRRRRRRHRRRHHHRCHLPPDHSNAGLSLVQVINQTRCLEVQLTRYLFGNAQRVAKETVNVTFSRMTQMACVVCVRPWAIVIRTRKLLAAFAKRQHAQKENNAPQIMGGLTATKSMVAATVILATTASTMTSVR